MESVVIQDFKFFIPAVVGKEKIWAHLDTGASQSSISTSLGERLPRAGQKTLQAGLARREVSQHLLPHLEFFGESFRDVPAAAVDNRDYFQGAPFVVHLTLGADLLLAKPLVLDCKRLWAGFAHKELRDDLPVVQTDYGHRLPRFTLRCGERKLRTVFDTGAAYSLLNSARLQPRDLYAPLHYQLEIQDPAGGRGQLPVYGSPEFFLGTLSLGCTEIVSVDLRAVEERLETEVDFVLGANLLLSSALVWVLDRENGRMLVSGRDVRVEK